MAPPTTKRRTRPANRASKRRPRWRRYVLWAIGAVIVCFYGAVILSLVLLRWIDPPTTSVQMERRVESWFSSNPYRKRYTFVPLRSISPAFQHAVIAAEDARFYQHHGFDWRQVEKAARQDLEGKRLRGASTIDQQLVKNLFLTTSRSIVRKAIEATIVPLVEVILGKQRILELYLNVVEWGPPGIYGAQASAEYWYHVPAARINRDQGARLAAILPAPHRRHPANMTQYSNVILGRMRQAGW
ncbi:MAG TPA: monofunctional biosynthetic peptidoglycan transglycosylase [Bryobacteraceae bacterium]